MPCGDMGLGQHWFRLWLVAWWQQAIIWTNVWFSLLPICGIHLGAISHWVSWLSFCRMSLKIILLELLQHLPGVNELKSFSTCMYFQTFHPDLLQMLLLASQELGLNAVEHIFFSVILSPGVAYVLYVHDVSKIYNGSEDLNWEVSPLMVAQGPGFTAYCYNAIKHWGGLLNSAAAILKDNSLQEVTGNSVVIVFIVALLCS